MAHLNQPAGESKSAETAVTTSGDAAAESPVSPNTAEPSAISPKKGRRRTRSTRQFTPQDALGILQQSFVLAQEAGIPIVVQNTDQGTVITLPNIQMANGWLMPHEDMAQ